MPDTSQLRWGILSTAAIAAERIIPAMREVPNAKIAAVASRSLDKARAFADKHGIPNALGSYEELIRSPDIDAIYVPLPVSMHRQWALACADARKPCLCEKPLAGTLDDVTAMVNGFAERGVFLAEALMARYNPMYRKVIEIVRSGRIGDVGQVRSSFTGTIHDRNDIRFRKDMGGGALLDLGIYNISFTRDVVGEEPDAVSALAGQFGEVDENLVGIMRFPSGAVAYLGCSINHQFDCSYQVIGTKGSIRVNEGGMVAWPGQAFTIEVRTGDERENIEIPPANHYALMLEDVSRAILGGRPPRYPVDDAIKNLRIIEKMLAMVDPYRNSPGSQ